MEKKKKKIFAIILDRFGMIPIRCLNAFFSRICLIGIIISVIFFSIFNLTKHLTKTSTAEFVPIQSHLRHFHSHDNHEQSRHVEHQVRYSFENLDWIVMMMCLLNRNL